MWADAAGPTTLTDVVITLNRHDAGPDGKAPKADSMHATLHVGGVGATQVAYQGPKGLLKAEQVELSGLDASAFNPGGGMPFTDNKKDHLAGT